VTSPFSPSQPMRILIVEDDRKVASFLQRGLKEEGYAPDVAHDGEDGLMKAMVHPYDLVILDVMLPQKDGWTVLREMRDAGKEVPVLFVTARESIEDRVTGLNLGADDYLVKPFAFSELLARVRSVLRRGPIRQPEVIRVGDLEVDLAGRRASRDGEQIQLTPKEFSLLSTLARHRGEILSRVLLAEKVWGMHFDSGTNVVEVAIRRLRAKIDEPFPQKLIHTIRGVGYVLDER
jgi:two-component system copper resistance phosphate regulon response regulator CusR